LAVLKRLEASHDEVLDEGGLEAFEQFLKEELEIEPAEFNVMLMESSV